MSHDNFYKQGLFRESGVRGDSIGFVGIGIPL